MKKTSLWILALFAAAITATAQQAGAYVFDHPEEHCFNVVFGAHQVTISIASR